MKQLFKATAKNTKLVTLGLPALVCLSLMMYFVEGQLFSLYPTREATATICCFMR